VEWNSDSSESLLGGGHDLMILRTRAAMNEHISASTVSLPKSAGRLLLERTVRKRKELERVARLALLGSLASGVAHDFANTFHAVLLRLEFLRSKGALSAADLNPLKRQINRAAQHTDQLREFIRGNVETTSTYVDLRETINDAIDLVHWAKDMGASGASTIQSCCELPNLPRIVGPVSDLTYLFVNLLMNAYEAMPAGGTAIIEGWEENGRVVIAIADQGTGIPPDLLPRIFSQFVTTKSSGTGLGLFMARKIMRRLGGSIVAENRQQGGAVFTLRFPAEPAPNQGPADMRRVIDTEQSGRSI
jgi:signal transduction histidine kinase